MTDLLPCPFCGGAAEQTESGAVMCGNTECITICGVPSNGFRKDHDPVALWNTRGVAQAPTDRERAAQIIYEAFPFDGGAAEKPPWLPGGNSLMQDRARRAADAIVASARLTPAQAASEPAAYLVAHSQAIEVFQYVQNAEHCRDKMGGTITPLYASPLPSTVREPSGERVVRFQPCFIDGQTCGCFSPCETAVAAIASNHQREDDELSEWKQAASVEAGLRREFMAQVDAAREFVKRHPALTLIDLAEFEAFLKVPRCSTFLH